MKGLIAGLLLAVSPVAAQFQLLSIDGVSELVVPDVRHLGTVARGDALSARFRLRNVTTSPAPMRLLEVGGTGFSFAAPVTIPQTVPVGGSIDFTVLFSAPSDGTYSAALRSEGVSVLLMASVVGQLTVALETTAGAVPLATGAVVSLGSVERGQSTLARLLIRNFTGRDEFVPPVTVEGDDFVLTRSASGTLLHPLEEARIELRFAPTAAQIRRGTLTVGTRGFTLNGVGVEPPLPKPGLSVVLPDAPASGQTGVISVLLEERSRSGGRGTLTLALRPAVAGAVDPLAVFSNGMRTAEFTVAPGDDRGYFADQPTISFQTGTTAGTLTVSMSIGSFADQRQIELAPAVVSLTSVETSRTNAGLELMLAGFDNTRTAGPVSFTFFDRSGSAIPPGAIRADWSSDLGRFFQASEMGGMFHLRAVFPVTGDLSAIDAVEVEMTNAAGVAKGRARF